MGGYDVKIIGFLAIFVMFAGVGYAAYSQESVCAGCVQIPASDIGLYQELFPLTIWTDSLVYDHTSVIQLNGYLKPENNVHPVTVTVSNPIGNIVAIEQVSPNPDGSFQIDFNTSSPLWAQDGFYIIKAQSGVDTRLFKTEIELVSYSVGTVSNCTESELSIPAENGGLYCIEYETYRGTTGVDAYLSLEKKTLSLDVRSIDVDSITLAIPRYLLDSKTVDNSDMDFGVFLNGKQIDYSEENESEDFRLVTISYPPDRLNRIDIVGTTVVPEFGIIASLVLVLGISTVLMLQMKRSRIF